MLLHPGTRKVMKTPCSSQHMCCGGASLVSTGWRPALQERHATGERASPQTHRQANRLSVVSRDKGSLKSPEAFSLGNVYCSPGRSERQEGVCSRELPARRDGLVLAVPRWKLFIAFLKFCRIFIYAAVQMLQGECESS